MNPLRAMAYVGLVIHVWDWISKLDAEYELLWSHPLSNLNAAQALYILTRYSPLLLHGSANFAAVHYSDGHPLPIPTHMCRGWLLFIVSSSCWLMGLLTINLMLRVYVLYNRDLRIILVMILLLLAKGMKVVAYRFIFLPTISFMPNCIPRRQQLSQIITFAAIEFIIQSIPVYLTFSRSAKLEHVTRVERITMLFRHMRRDGVFCVMGTAMFSILVLAVGVSVRRTPSTLPLMTYPLFVSFISILVRSVFPIVQPLSLSLIFRVVI
ncbi:hypothetical protein P691DRAFT_251729 [Macrolepiota fuliginosa MF-IS2]|uniref:DUF6533 domain-containing protein n=1 Tax=Macrolepiota fuliginosa MF-IS2 TaxID=1400762 RepID=A0A9P6BZ21_9AGAR|nr:hypothetical protein P691DRAFT_251729 [Macrolepiota fuliginosa MF-IS2]